MALQPSTHPSAHAHASHTSQASHTHAAHAASKAKPSLSAEDGEGGGFAAQLLKAQPAADKDVKAVDARPKADAAKKPSEDKSGRDGADAKDGSQEEKDAKAPEGKPPVVDPAALLAAQQPVAPATTSLADKTAATGDHDDFATDPLGALRKAAVRPGKDDGKAALLAGLGAGKQAPATATATATSAGLYRRGVGLRPRPKAPSRRPPMHATRLPRCCRSPTPRRYRPARSAPRPTRCSTPTRARTRRRPPRRPRPPWRCRRKAPRSDPRWATRSRSG
jgi:hypothetical protein